MCNNFPNLTKTINHRSKKFSELPAQETQSILLSCLNLVIKRFKHPGRKKDIMYKEST